MLQSSLLGQAMSERLMRLGSVLVALIRTMSSRIDAQRYSKIITHRRRARRARALFRRPATPHVRVCGPVAQWPLLV